MTKTVLKEETSKEIFEQWEAESKKVESVDAFIEKMRTDYQHDYGTVVHSIFHCMMAAFRKANNTFGGITGFQASCLGWMLIPEMFCISKGKPLRLVNYNEMLFPQYEEKFKKTITESTWRYLQEEAGKKLKEVDPYTSAKVIEHWHSIADGEVPFGYKVIPD